MTDLPASAFDSQDCATPGCPREANSGSDFCRYCEAERARPRTRAQVSGQVLELRSRGLKQREIAEEVGISRSYVANILCDPDGSADRARKASYRLPCPGCGALMTGCNGLGENAPSLCATCSAQALHDDRLWTPERIVQALQEFRERTGRTLTAVDVQVRSGAPSVERKLPAERLAEIAAIPDDLYLPQPSVVAREFGSWTEGLIAAGMEPNGSGGPTHRSIRRGVPKMKQFIVLAKNGVGWIPRDTVEAFDVADAIQQVADGQGTYVAVQAQHWTEKTVAPKTVFAVVGDA